MSKKPVFEDFEVDTLNEEVKFLQGTSENAESNEICSFEVAVSKTGHGKFHYFLLLVCGFSMMGFATEGLNVGFVLQTAKCDLKFTRTEQGWANSVGLLGIVCSAYFWGLLADTWGRIKVLRISAALSFIFSIISSLSISVKMFIVLRFIVGVVVAGIQSAGLSYLGEFHSNKTRARAVSFVTTFFLLCLSYMPLLAWAILPLKWRIPMGLFAYVPWRLYILISSSVMALAFVAFCFLPESPKFLFIIGKKAEALNVLKIIYNINTGQPKHTFTVKEIQEEVITTNTSEKRKLKDIPKLVWNQTWPLFMPPHWLNTLRLCYVMFIMFAASFGSIFWLPSILSSMADNSHQSITMCSAVTGSEMGKITNVTSFSECERNINIQTYQIVASGGFIIFGITLVIINFINRIKVKLLFTTWMTLCAVSSIAIVWSTNFYLTSLLVLLFLSSCNAGNIVMSLSADLFPTNIKSMALSLASVAIRLGAISGSTMIGALVISNCNLIFFIYGGLLLSGSIICYYFPRTSATRN